MPSSLKWFPRPRMMTIKYGKGTLRAKVLGTYTRYVGGKRHTSHHIGRLDDLRYKGVTKERNGRLHHKHEQFTDTPKSRR